MAGLFCYQTHFVYLLFRYLSLFVVVAIVGVTTVYQTLLEVSQVSSDLHVSVSESFKATAITGGCTLAGSLLLGPPGILVGAAVGGVAAYASSRSFKPVGEVLQNMNDKEKENLKDAVVRVAKEKGISLLTAAVWETLSQTELKDILIDALKLIGYKLK